MEVRKEMSQGEAQIAVSHIERGFKTWCDLPLVERIKMVRKAAKSSIEKCLQDR